MIAMPMEPKIATIILRGKVKVILNVRVIPQCSLTSILDLFLELEELLLPSLLPQVQEAFLVFPPNSSGI